MITELPNDWYEEETMQPFILNPGKVLVEINRLRAELGKIAAGSDNDGLILGSGEMMEIAKSALGDK